MGQAGLLGIEFVATQQQSIREINMRLAKDDGRRNAEITVARMELVELARKTPMDINALQGRLKQILALDLKVQLSHFKAMAEIESKLTPEQQRRLTSIRQGLGANKRSRRTSQKDLENNPQIRLRPFANKSSVPV